MLRVLRLSTCKATSNSRPLRIQSKSLSHRYYASLQNQQQSEATRDPNDNHNDQQQNHQNGNPYNIIFPIVGVSIGTMALGAVLLKQHYERILEESADDDHQETLLNWSGTHSITPHHLFTPQSTLEVEALVAQCHDEGTSFRPMGSGISPNGLAFSENAVMDLSGCNKVLSVDPQRLQITVESGIRVQDVLKVIVPYGMTLQNIPSVQMQQIGGLMQVGAHGTGIEIPPCDAQVLSMTMVTPSKGRLELTPKDELFHFARCGVGALGVVTQATLQCVPRHKLKEEMWTMDAAELIKRRDEFLFGYRHCKWLWIPYSDNKVVVIASNPVEDAHAEALSAAMTADIESEQKMEIQCQREMRELLAMESGQNVEDLSDSLSFADLRDLLLGVDDANRILDTEWIKKVNAAEMKYWSAAAGTEREYIDFSDNVLSFDCGGQQWVFELCFPISKHHDRAHGTAGGVPTEIQFALDVLSEIEKRGIPAPAPLEQRFSARSKSCLSPAHSDEEEAAFCWFGVIFYLPTQEERKRKWIANEFQAYSRVFEEIADRYGAVGHWAKIETDYLTKEQREKLQQRLKRRHGAKLERFLELKKELDPKGIMTNDLLRDCFDL